MNNYEGKKFKSRTGGKNKVVFVLAFMFFPIFGIMMMIYGSFRGVELAGGIVLTGGGLVAVFYILARSTASGFDYRMSNDELILKRGRGHRRISLKDIEAAVMLEGKDLSDFLDSLSRPIAESKLQMNIGNWWKTSKIYGEIVRWVSIAITETETKAGGPLSIVNYTINIDGPAILMKLEDDEMLMITPEATDEFLAILFSLGVETITASDCISLIPLPGAFFNDDKSVNRGRRIRIVSIITALLIIAIVILWFFVAGPGKEYTEQAYSYSVLKVSILEEHPVDGFWEDDDTFFMVLRADDPLVFQGTEVGQTAHPRLDIRVSEAIAITHEKHTGITSSPEIINDIEIHLRGLVPLIFQGVVNDDAGDEYHIYSIRAVGLKAGINNILQ